MPTIRQGNLPIEPHEILVKCFKTLSSHGLHAKKREKLQYLNVVYSLANSRSVFQQPEKKEKLKQRAYRSNDVQFIQQGVWKFIFPSKFKRGSMFCDNRKKNSPKRHVTVVEY